MNESPPLSLDAILRYCAEAAPEPWYPSAYAQATGTPRDALDPFLERLRQGGFIQLTDWVAGKGQGYRLTPDGVQLLQSPRLLGQVQAGHLPASPGRLEEVRQHEPPATADGARRDAIRAAFDGRFDKPKVTIGLIAANVAVFAAGMALAAQQGLPLNKFVDASDPRILHWTGAITSADILVRHEWWRLLTCCFVHIGMIHLAVNMYSLYVIGPLLERLWGPWRFLTLYLVAGLGGSCAMVWDTPLAQGAGASGAIWGVLASMVTWIVLNRRVLNPELVGEWRRQLLVTFVLNLGITLAVPGISKGAHFGGGAVGLLAGLPLDWTRFGGPRLRALGVVALLVIPVGCLAGMRYGLEQKRSSIELRSFLVTAVGPLQESVQDVEAARQSLATLLEQHPSRRDPAKVREALDRLTRVTGELQDVLAAVDAETYSLPNVSRLQEATRQLLGVWIDALTAGHDYLTKGEAATRADEAAVEEKVRQMVEQYSAWKDVVKQVVR